MTANDFMEEQELFALLGKKKTAVWRLRKDHELRFPCVKRFLGYSAITLHANRHHC
jgi:hypothetical protein